MMPHTNDRVSAAQAPTEIEATYRKITRRIIPFLVVCYVFNFIDRSNIGIAKLQFMSDLGFNQSVYAVGTGIFFVGYLLFEVPSNLLLARIGARKTLLRIMFAWGIVSAGMMFVHQPSHFYLARFALGAAEAGFVPGIFLYLTYWYPSYRRARITSLFYLALPLSVLIGSPLAGAIMKAFDGVHGLHGWQWLFLLEGIPSVLLGVTAFFYLQDRPEKASWLSANEKATVADALAAEEHHKPAKSSHGFMQALSDPRLYLLGVVSFASYCASNMNNYWAPTIIRDSGVHDIFWVGVFGAFPPVLGAISMVLVSRHSDRTLERRWHAALPLIAAAIAVALLPTFSTNTPMSVVLIGVLAAGHYSTLSVFWTIPSGYLSKAAVAGGIAMVSTIGALGAVVSPLLLTWTRQMTGGPSLGFYLTAAIIASGAIALVVGMPARLLRESAARGAR